MRRFATSDGLSLAYRDEGAGPPVLCLPGLTRNASDFDDLAAARGDRLRLIRLDPRGRGASDRAPDPAQYVVPVEARDAVELLDHLGVPRVTIVGTSRGGIAAMVIAATVKPRLAGVLLNDIGPDIAPEGLARIMGYLGLPPRARSFEAAALGLEAVMGAEFPGVSHERWLTCARRWFDAGEDGLVLNYDARLRGAVEGGAAQPAPDLWPFFDALSGLPLAALRGANSALLTPETFAAMQERRPDMIAATVPDRGHVPFLDEPEALAAFDALMARVTP